MDTRLITTTEDLTAFCKTFGDEEFITVDTEFIRERTYFPQLCLMQVATSKEAVAIDPLVEGMDLISLYEAFADEWLMKVFHACGQDIEIFVHESGRVPYPLYDTQIAAMVCGFGESISYENLVNDVVGATLDKASRFTDWAKRPLTRRQMDYALDDVIHLREIYTELKKQIADDGRTEWIAEEMQNLADITKYRVDANRAWVRLKVKSRSPEVLNILRACAAWREEMAAKRDVPRQRILKDDYVVQIAMRMPESVDELLEVRGIQGQMSREWMAGLVDKLHEARMAPRETFPEPEAREKPMPAAQEACYDQLKLLLKIKCEDAHVVPRLVADKEELEMLVRGKISLEKTSFGHGWRYEIFGRFAQDLLNGKLTARVEQVKGGYGLVWRM